MSVIYEVDSLEGLIPVADVGKHFPVSVSPGTVSRWYTSGIGGIKLQTIKIGGRRYATREAIDAFISAQNQSSTNDKKGGEV